MNQVKINWAFVKPITPSQKRDYWLLLRTRDFCLIWTIHHESHTTIWNSFAMTFVRIVCGDGNTQPFNVAIQRFYISNWTLFNETIWNAWQSPLSAKNCNSIAHMAYISAIFPLQDKNFSASQQFTLGSFINSFHERHFIFPYL